MLNSLQSFPIFIFILFCIIQNAGGEYYGEYSPKVTKARAYLFKSVQSPESTALQPLGVVDFCDLGKGLMAINGTLTGLPPGLHGFHVHQFGDLSQLCTGAGLHFNPHNRRHGAPQDSERHVGDLGNIQADENGIAIIRIRDRYMTFKGVNSIIGRGLLVHEKVDDLGRGGNDESLKTGNAGPRFGCGVIGIRAENL
uniref:Superoxide dismutase [Cu-Zn] n=1 Tax=Meloidogyne floridensis TaxID=298350 RepID=A0A915NSW4_9BILA